MTNAYLKPIIKWVGGKRQLLGDIVPLVPMSPTLYVEPFVGGGAVFLDVCPECARINDSNKELINMYRVVRGEPDNLLGLLEAHKKNNSKEYYYKIRELDRTPAFEGLSDVERAARFIYLNKTCFNGLYRVNSHGQMNVPYGRYKNPNIVNEQGVRALSAYLNENNVEITCGDYTNVLCNLPKGAFVYLDPPYMPISATSSFTGYTQGGFSYDEQVRLRDECVKLHEQGVSFIQSNSDCEVIRELYKKFRIRVVKAKRAVNRCGDKRGCVNEVLISG